MGLGFRVQVQVSDEKLSFSASAAELKELPKNLRKQEKEVRG